MKELWLAAIYGPTGSGKTWLADGIAERFGAQLINADAFQVYRGLDVGTAKPSNKSRYQLLDLVDPEEDFSVVQWVREAEAALNDAWSRGQCVVLVGGTGFYMRALLERYAELGTAPDPVLRADLMREEQDLGLGHLVSRLQAIDPEAAGRIDLKNPVRVRRALERALSPKSERTVNIPPFPTLKFATWPEGDWHDLAIRQRVNNMWVAGWPQEVNDLLRIGVRPEAPGMRAIGYHTMVKHLEGLVTEQEAKESIVLATRQYAKRQKTWIRSEPRVEYLKLNSGDLGELAQTLEDVCLRLESLESIKVNG